jgi:hypothetical protein
MAKAAKAISSRIVAIVVIAMIIVVGLGVVSSGVLNSASSTTVSTSGSSSSTSSATSSTTGNSTSSSSSVTLSSSNGLNQTLETSNSTLDLELILSVNSATIPSEDAIGIAASVLNSRSTANNLTASNDWPVQGLTTGPCPSPELPAGIAAFRGNYGKNNLSSAKPLEIWPLISCPAYAVLNVTSYSFLPKEDVANYSGYFVTSSQSPPARQESYTRIAFGASIYAANGTGFYSSLDSSLPSTYTLVAGDEWGQVVLLHFKVTASDNLPKVGNFLSSAGGCSPGPCIGQRFSDALVFNCANAAATPSGCVALYSEGVRYSAAPMVNYTVTVWYPSYNQPNEPTSANCMYNVTPVGALVKPETPTLFGYCLMVNSTAFVVTLPLP